MGARRYEISLRIFGCLCKVDHEKRYSISTSNNVQEPPVMYYFVYYIDILITTFLTIFRRFPITFQRFPKIPQNCPKSS